jgi:hypothetical protein
MAQTLFGTAWIAAQNDVEWRWLLTETAQGMAAQGPFNFRQLATALAGIAASALVEREPRLAGKVRGQDLYEVARAFAHSQPDGWIAQAPLPVVVEALSQAFLLASATFLMGVPSPWAPREAGYWPFGNEGGFCNPIKLQHLDG